MDSSPNIFKGPKRCSRCGRLKKMTDFCRAKHHKDGLSSQCRMCIRKSARERYRRARSDEIVAETKQCAACGQVKSRTEFYHNGCYRDGLTQNCRACHGKQATNSRSKPGRTQLLRNARRRQYWRSLRAAVIAGYGGRCECAGCGEDHPEFLEIHHRFNDGAAERGRESGAKFYRRLIREGFPRERYALLCSNCNLARERGGACPHEREQRQLQSGAKQIGAFGSMGVFAGGVR